MWGVGGEARGWGWEGGLHRRAVGARAALMTNARGQRASARGSLGDDINVAPANSNRGWNGLPTECVKVVI